MDGKRLGQYTRYSLLVGGDDALSRQNEDGEEFAFEYGGTVTRVYEEKTSAWKKRRIVQPDGRIITRVVRPEYQKLLEDLRNREIDGAVVYDLDRLTRDLRDLEDAIEVVEVYGCPIVGPGVDLTTEHGRNAARAQAVAANKASADTSRRVKRAHKQYAREGKPVGTVRPFGWNADQRTLCEPEADAIREAVADLAGGMPIAEIVRRWNRAGFTGTRGAAFRLTTVQQIMRNPRLCGLRASTTRTPNDDGTINTRMELVTRKEKQPDGTTTDAPVVGQWERIVTPEQWHAMLAVIGDRHIRARGRNARVHLLSGIARCGLCTAGMRCCRAKTSPEGIYQCKPKTQGGCGGVGRKAKWVDDYVLSALFHKIEAELLAAQATAVPEVRVWPRQAEYDEVRETLAETRDAWTSVPRRISAKTYFPTLEVLEEKEHELEEDRARFLGEVTKVSARQTDIRAEWDGYTLARQRAIVREHLTAVVIYPVGKGRQTFDPDKIETVWRD
ncbi:recombinase family protein [Frankia sp. AiPs1]|uniref:recombinase family protein n=1 Tax=Frankia sp. AiPs1 TaxID=573493 RepID=UPI00204347B6|nr:recombinase family protein [Frankia sp. AiPs1]MCM3922250.1 recombinase family protein [Frankia sp. AiPs1]